MCKVICVEKCNYCKKADRVEKLEVYHCDITDESFFMHPTCFEKEVADFCWDMPEYT